MSEALQTALILLLAAELLVCLVRWIADAPRRDWMEADARARAILREGSIKELTGGAPMKVRELTKGFVDFEPEFRGLGSVSASDQDDEDSGGL